MSNIKSLILTASVSIAAMGCATYEHTRNPLPKPTKASRTIASYTGDRLSVPWSDEARLDYGQFMGECLGVLKNMGRKSKYTKHFQCLTRHRQYAAQKIRLVAIDKPGWGEPIIVARSGTLDQKHQQFSISLSGNMAIPRSSCFQIVNEANKPIPIRGETHTDRFSFAIPHINQRAQMRYVESRLAETENNIAVLEGRLRQARSSLAINTAFKNNQCVKPSVSLPSKPQGLSPSELTYNAEQGCYRMLERRFPKQNVRDAMFAIGRDYIVENSLAYERNRESQEECAQFVLPQAETMPVRIICGIFGSQISNICIQDTFDRCVVAAKSACQKPQARYAQKVHSIQTAQAKLFQSCQAQVDDIVAMEHSLNTAKINRTQLISRLDALRNLATSVSAPMTPVSLETATCLISP